MNFFPVGQTHFLATSAFLFTLGVLTVVVRRNLIVILMGVELMLNAGNLAIVAFSRFSGHPAGHVYVLLIMTVAAAEVAVGLGILIALFRTRKTINADEATYLRW
ncbi:MAG: NADH-quinone oxidoreductase subunit K [Candidatus Lindowbacteria bacterium RIFCSPLOWO2_12_FULL_62_27]|nr:MAG: NADH-quinone oxidoreductase subunit K [Candidatus Lindowbacteria bacterium RIFCSPLOWO2_12_FULL_62_27]OGH61176.1 MAG: NADH-quinone oxidoreductase subunit K [Candidatus Lindowbacteria bacterium RIFCSPLOWO2_02_FULL_62_12]